MPDTIVTTLIITDEQGQPIPHATIWGYHLPRCNGAEVLALDGDDLWRLAHRFRDSFEFAAPFNPIVRELWVTPMGDAKGLASLTLSYEEKNGMGQKRPPQMRVGFVVLKRGYLPARLDFEVGKESKLAGHVVLKRDPAQPVEIQPYLLDFERLRFELSDTHQFASLQQSVEVRIYRIRTDLESAARQALTAGDKPAAARIYARMQYLPFVILRDGKPSGFTQAEPYTPEYFAYLHKAYELDPKNAYIAAKYLFRMGAEQFSLSTPRYSPKTASPAQRQVFGTFLEGLHELMRTQGNQIWPAYHKLYTGWLRYSDNPKDRDNVIPLLEALHKWEPKFEAQ